MSLIDKIKSPSDLKKLTLKEKYEYAAEAREEIIDVISNRGGHLASNLGVVELTVALHSVFNSPEDKIIWDVSHQSYTHKLITGRIDNFDTIRTFGGLSGFTNTEESEHDFFTTGHAGNSISLAMGLAKARDLEGNKGNIIAVIGDASICNGMAFEALNNMQHAGSKVIIVLNDNEMSISKNVGALAKNFSRLRLKYRLNKTKKVAKKSIGFIPGAKFAADTCVGLYHGFIRLFQSVKGVFFQELGLTYLGPYDGHKIEDIEKALIGAKQNKNSTVVHIITQKGHGYEYAEKNPGKFHGIGKFNVLDGVVEKKDSNISFTSAFSHTICKLAEENENICAVTAAMPDGCGLSEFGKKYPKRFFDVGMSEEHAVSFGAGLAKGGMKPFVCVYSTFLQRAYDQINHDVCMQNLPVVFMIDRSGLVGEDGQTHHGIFDISYLSNIPNITIISPKDTNDLEAAVKFSLSINSPVAIRYPRGAGNTEYIENSSEIIYGKGEVISAGNPLKLKDVFKKKTPPCVFMACGRMVYTALAVKEILKNDFNIEVWDARFVKPIDKEYIGKIAKENNYIFTFEENVLTGGFGSLVGAYLNELGKGSLLKKSFGISDSYVPHGSVNELMNMLDLTPEKISETIKSMF